MTCEEKELKRRLKENGITYKQLASHLGRSYQTIASWMNGFSPLPDTERIRIEKMIESKTKNQTLELLVERTVIQIETYKFPNLSSSTIRKTL